ncbi:DEAD/DEAH box helicase [Reinekea marina]|uniref:DEAD/DEAH box helicase n=1 Tax=Reinekea marina TaxID=1310421 RepID=A0ABV7WP44_9GAMM|nr:DEAD/DEAH box helicase [Reinekea marina]MDN3648454.1 DEAD/DEAH box helicase [Reinekea marina]
MTDPVSFADLGLNERLLKALDKHNFTTPTAVQEATIPPALYGQDLMVSAKTGSGKTAAFVLPILDKLLQRSPRNTGTRALILVPTRELAKQVFKQIKMLSSFTRLQTGLIIGGEDYNFQKVILRDNPEIIVGTPGRIVEHMEKGATDFEDLEVLVLDEADRMLDMGFTDDVLNIVAQCDLERQTLFFSATLKQRQIMKVGEQVLTNPEKIILETVRDENKAIQQQYVLADDERHKERILLWLLANEPFDKALVFTNSRESTARLGQFVSGHTGNSAFIHGELDQQERTSIMASFRSGKTKVLIATDVASRGLDISGVDLVINFHMARNGDDYVHRIGRTGRAGATGKAISLIAHNEWNLKAGISKYIKVELEHLKIKAVEGTYKGPKKVKASGKAASTKKKVKLSPKQVKQKEKAKLKAKPKGKGPKSPAKQDASVVEPGDGFGTIKKKKRPFVE